MVLWEELDIMLTGMLHMHVSTWFIGILLFIVSYILLKKKMEKGQKITHMILRLFYVLIVVSGATIVILFSIDYGFPVEYGIKAILGLIVVSLMEWILVNGKRGVNKPLHWILFLISLALVLYYGYVVL